MLPGRSARPAPPRAGLVLALVLLASALFAPGAVRAVVLASGDGSGNTAPPADDFGFDHVGTRLPGNLSAVYLRKGWVVTAAHAGAGTLRLGGVDYAAIPGSSRALIHAGSAPSDLLLFRLVDETGLAPLAIRASTPALNADVTLVGNGHDRGAATSYAGYGGWGWLATRSLRWGTNRVAQRNFDATIGGVTTRALATVFDLAGGTPHEAQAAVGDSGGGVFLKNGASWELAGVLVAVGTYEGQPTNTSLDGNVTYVADLAYYRTQIAAIADVPACRNGLDDDQDGAADYPADAGCRDADDTSERYACENQLDDDGDGLVDALDPQCLQANVDSETPAACGLAGPEALAGLAVARSLRRRWRRLRVASCNRTPAAPASRATTPSSSRPTPC